jgi:HEAT repeat protein
VTTIDQIKNLISNLESDDWTLREKAYHELAELKYFDSADVMIAKLPDEKVSDVREAMAYALGEIGGDAAIAQLIQLLNDEHSFVVEAASESLIAIGDQSIPALLEGLKISDSKIKQEVIVTLSLLIERVVYDRAMKWTGDRDFLLSTIRDFDAGNDEGTREFCGWAIRELEQ